MKPLRRAGSSPLSSACRRRESPPVDWTMETTFCTLSSCFPDRAPSRDPTSSVLPPRLLPPYCSSRSSALSLTKLLQHNSLNMDPKDMFVLLRTVCRRQQWWSTLSSQD